MSEPKPTPEPEGLASLAPADAVDNEGTPMPYDDAGGIGPPISEPYPWEQVPKP